MSDSPVSELASRGTTASDMRSPAPTSRFSPGLAGKAYDLLAHRYDDLYRENSVLAQSARVSLSILRTVMDGHSSLLELGCGTGRETLVMAALGKHVVACDPSREALRVLHEKARELDLLDRIDTHELPASGVEGLASEYGRHAFDGAYSSFALSYEPNLVPVRDRVWELLRPDSPFVCSIYNRSCLMEWVLLAPFLVPRRGLSRLEGETSLPVDRAHVRIRSYLASEVRRIFDPRFALVQTWGIPAVIPPNYLHVLLDHAGSLRGPWEELDLRLNGRWPFKYLGSHTAYLFRSRAQTVIA